MAYAEKRGKGKLPWRARYKLPDGTLGSEPGFRTKRQAEVFGEDQEAEIRAGRWIHPDKRRTLFQDWVPIWMDAQEVDHNTVAQRKRDLKALLLPGFGDTALEDINLFGVKAWAKKQNHARTRVDKAMTLLSMILTGAADAGYIHANPLAGRRRSSGRGRKQSQSTEPEKVFAQPEQAGQIADRMTPANGLMVLSDAFLGARWGELAGLHRDNALILRRDDLGNGEVFERYIMRIDPEVGTLHEVEFELTEEELTEWHVREATRLAKAATAGRMAQARKRPETTVRTYLGPPKNETSAREIDLPPFLAALWREHLQTWPHQYMFVGPRGGWHRRGNFGARHLRPAADGRGARPGTQGHPPAEKWPPILPGFTMRAARGTANTWMKEDGVDRALRYLVMGWATDDIEGVYERVTPMMRKHRLDALEARWVRARRGTRWDLLRKAA